MSADLSLLAMAAAPLLALGALATLHIHKSERRDVSSAPAAASVPPLAGVAALSSTPSNEVR